MQGFSVKCSLKDFNYNIEKNILASNFKRLDIKSNAKLITVFSHHTERTVTFRIWCVREGMNSRMHIYRPITKDQDVKTEIWLYWLYEK